MIGISGGEALVCLLNFDCWCIVRIGDGSGYFSENLSLGSSKSLGIMSNSTRIFCLRDFVEFSCQTLQTDNGFHSY
jgi:hypothetical protein